MVVTGCARGSGEATEKRRGKVGCGVRQRPRRMVEGRFWPEQIRRRVRVGWSTSSPLRYQGSGEGVKQARKQMLWLGSEVAGTRLLLVSQAEKRRCKRSGGGHSRSLTKCMSSCVARLGNHCPPPLLRCMAKRRRPEAVELPSERDTVRRYLSAPLPPGQSQAPARALRWGPVSPRTRPSPARQPTLEATGSLLSLNFHFIAEIVILALSVQSIGCQKCTCSSGHAKLPQMRRLLPSIR